MTDAMIELLGSALGQGVRVDPRDHALLQQRYDQARGRWPDVEVPFANFGLHVAARLPRETPVFEGVEQLCTDDLYLACGCVLGEPRAIEAFEREVLEGARRRLERFASGSTDADDLMQRLRQKLLVGEDDGEPRIASYGGRGDLASWVKVVAVREGLMATRGQRPQVGDDVLELAAGQDDPELDLMRSHYQGAFREAFAEALGALAPDERNLLRFHLVDRLSIDRIAAIEGVHRATAARRLARVRDKLHATTRARLTSRLRVDGLELESILRLVRSRLDVSVRRLLERA